MVSSRDLKSALLNSFSVALQLSSSLCGSLASPRALVIGARGVLAGGLRGDLAEARRSIDACCRLRALSGGSRALVGGDRGGEGLRLRGLSAATPLAATSVATQRATSCAMVAAAVHLRRSNLCNVAQLEAVRRLLCLFEHSDLTKSLGNLSSIRSRLEIRACKCSASFSLLVASLILRRSSS